jgi:Flp pilus assembly pilin Flp
MSSVVGGADTWDVRDHLALRTLPTVVAVRLTCALLARSRADRGASLVEYTLLVAFIALACFTALGFLGGRTGRPLSNVQSGLR